MLIFLYGQDTYRLNHKLREILNRYKKIHKSGLSLKRLDGATIDFQSFEQEIRSVSMFQEKRLLVVENFLSNAAFKNHFLKNAQKFIQSKSIIIFFEEGQAPKKDLLFNLLKEKARSQEFALLTGQKLKNWAQKEFIKYQCRVEEEALKKLTEWIGSDLWLLSGEIKKIATFKMSNNKPPLESDEKFYHITLADIKSFVKPRIETDIFKTINSLAEKNKQRALMLIKKHIEEGDSPLYLLSMIGFQFRNLLIVKTLIENHTPYFLIAQRSGLHPFVVKKSYWHAAKFSLPELKKIYQKIFQVDLDIKAGKIEPEVAIDMLIAEI